MLLKSQQRQNQFGQSLIELLIVIALAAILLPTLLGSLASTREGKAQQKQRIQATLLLKEAQEATRNIREKGWSTFAINGTYHPAISGSTWSLATGAEIINGITRQIVISDVSRDGNGNIVISGGTVDPSTKQIITTVSWIHPTFSSLQSTMYLTRYMNNTSFTQTTVSDFTGVSGNMSNLIGTAITNNSGGEVVLGAGHANWCNPQDYIESTYTLPKQANAIAALPGLTSGSASSAYIGMGDGTNGITFQQLSMSDPVAPTPPIISAVGSGYISSFKTNAVFNDGTYSYLATNGTTSQVVILNSSYTKIGGITLPSNVGANGIYVTGSIAYITSGSQLYTYNVSNPAVPIALGSAALWDSNATAKQVVVQLGKAYVSMSGSITGLELFTIAGGGAVITPWSVASVNWQQTPQGLAVNSTGTRAYIAFSSSSSVQGGFFIVDTSTRLFGFFNPNVATYNTNWDGNGSTNPLGMVIATANKAIIVGTGGSQQYQIVDITNDTPTHCGGLSISQGVSGAAAVIQQDGRVFSYIISGEANNQFKVIEGGTGGSYTDTGTFESTIYDPNFSTSYNRFSASINQPPQTTLQMQIAVAPPVSGNCINANFYYVGPNGVGGSSPSAYFTPNGSTISGIIPFGTSASYQNPAECFRYKAYFSTTDTSESPTLDDITVNYSP